MAGMPTSEMTQGIHNWIKKSKFRSTAASSALVTFFIYIGFPLPWQGLLYMMAIVGLLSGIVSLFFWTEKKWIYIPVSFLIVFLTFAYLGTH